MMFPGNFASNQELFLNYEKWNYVAIYVNMLYNHSKNQARSYSHIGKAEGGI